MATLQADPVGIETQVDIESQPRNIVLPNSRWLFQRIKSRLAGIPATPSSIIKPPLLHEQSPPVPESITRASSDATVGSASRTSTTSTTATSVLPLPCTFLVQRFHISPSAPVQEEIQEIWIHKIKSRLRAILIYEIPTGTCVQELMMAGKRPDALKPTVIVSCGDTVTKKKVEKAFKAQVWLQDLLKGNGMMFIVVIARTRLSMSPEWDPTHPNLPEVTEEGSNLGRELYASVVSLEDRSEEGETPVTLESPELRRDFNSISGSASYISNIASSLAISSDFQTTVTTNGLPTVYLPSTVFSTEQASPTSATVSPPSQSQNTTTSQRSNLTEKIVVGVTVPLTVLVFLVVCFLLLRRRRYLRTATDGSESEACTMDNRHWVTHWLRTTPADEKCVASTTGTSELVSQYQSEEIPEMKEKNALPGGAPIGLATDLLISKYGRIPNVGRSALKIYQACSVLLPRDKVHTACGLNILIHNSEAQNQGFCTLGGLIIVEGEICGLTAGHPFREGIASNSEQNVQDITEPEICSGDEGEDEPFVFNGEDESSLEVLLSPASPATSIPTNVGQSSIKIIPLEYLPMPSCDIIVPMSTPTQYLPADDSMEFLDWGLVKSVPPSLLSALTNKISPTGPVVTRFISPTPQGEVKILINAVESEVPQLGYLHSSPVTLIVNGASLDVRIITLEEKLSLGCSGSWVIFEGQLCGIIIAIREDLPWAYMAPIGPIFEDIETKLGTRDVGLPRTGEVGDLADVNL